MTRRRLRIAIACAVAGVAATALAGPAGAATKIAFVQGEQNVTVTRPGDGLPSAVASLLAGPTAAEKKTQIRSYILPARRCCAVSQAGTVATIDLGARFVAGTDSDTLLARLSQVVDDRDGRARRHVGPGAGPGRRAARAVPGDQRDRAAHDGGPAHAQRRAAAAHAREAHHAEPRGTKAAQQRLADLGYLLPAALTASSGRPRRRP